MALIAWHRMWEALKYLVKTCKCDNEGVCDENKCCQIVNVKKAAIGSATSMWNSNIHAMLHDANKCQSNS